MRRYQITIGDKTFEVEVLDIRGGQARVLVDGRPYEARFEPLTGAAAGPATAALLKKPALAPATPPPAPRAAPPPPPAAVPGPAAPAPGQVSAPMPGVILEVLVKKGDRVKAGDTVVKLEAMKMENDLKVSIAGVVTEVRVGKGANVSVGEVLVVVSES
jgi:biotin carboxyl carrier protein